MRDDTRLLEKKKLLADRRAAAEETRGAGGTLDGYDPGTDAADHPVEAL